MAMTVGRAEGERVAGLLLEQHKWVHRRVESIEFVDELTVRRRVSVDFDVVRRRVSWPSRTVVPLAFVQRPGLVGFDLYDETSKRVPLLTTPERGEYMRAALSAIGRRVLQKGLPKEVAADLHAFTCADDADVADALDALMHRPNRTREREKLFDDPTFARVARSLAGGFFLFVPIERPGRRILKFSYLTAPASEDVGLIVAGAFGWRATWYRFDAPAIAESETYHMEVRAPDGLEFVDGEFGLETTKPVTSTRVRRMGDDSAHVHFYTSGATDSHESGFAQVALRPPRGGFVLVCAAVSFIAAVLLTLMAASNFTPTGGTSDAVSLLLTIPGALAVASVRAGEHPILRRMLFQFRMVVVVSAALSFAAAVQMGTGSGRVCLTEWSLGEPDPGCLGFTMWWWAIASASCCLLTAPAVFHRSPPFDSKAGTGRVDQGRKGRAGDSAAVEMGLRRVGEKLERARNAYGLGPVALEKARAHPEAARRVVDALWEAPDPSDLDKSVVKDLEALVTHKKKAVAFLVQSAERHLAIGSQNGASGRAH